MPPNQTANNSHQHQSLTNNSQQQSHSTVPHGQTRGRLSEASLWPALIHTILTNNNRNNRRTESQHSCHQLFSCHYSHHFTEELSHHRSHHRHYSRQRFHRLQFRCAIKRLPPTSTETTKNSQLMPPATNSYANVNQVLTKIFTCNYIAFTSISLTPTPLSTSEGQWWYTICQLSKLFSTTSQVLKESPLNTTSTVLSRRITTQSKLTTFFRSKITILMGTIINNFQPPINNRAFSSMRFTRRETQPPLTEMSRFAKPWPGNYHAQSGHNSSKLWYLCFIVISM